MTKLHNLIFNAVHRVLRIAQLPTKKAFFEMKVKDTMANAEGPNLQSEFWWDAIATEIQTAAMARRWYITNWDAKKLRSLSEETWADVYEFADSELGPLG